MTSLSVTSVWAEQKPNLAQAEEAGEMSATTEAASRSTTFLHPDFSLGVAPSVVWETKQTPLVSPTSRVHLPRSRNRYSIHSLY